MKTSIKNVGAQAEELAKYLYQKRGFKFITQNIYNKLGKRMGEIDLVMASPSTLVFIEVKARSNSKFGDPVEFVDKAKQVKLIKTGYWFLKQFPLYQKLQPRFDVVAVLFDQQKFFSSGAIDKSLNSVTIYTNTVEVKQR